MDPKPIEFWRERIEKNPGSVRLMLSSGLLFTPFYFANGVAHGKDGLGASIDCDANIAEWFEKDVYENYLLNVQQLATDFGVSPKDVLDARNEGAISYDDFKFRLSAGRHKARMVADGV